MPWLISVILFLTTITGWFFYYQKASDVTRSEGQNKRLQSRYDNKVAELYTAWDDLQKSKNEQYQLADKSQSCENDKAQLSLQIGTANDSAKSFQKQFQNCQKKQQSDAEKLAVVNETMAQIKAQIAEKESLFSSRMSEFEKLKGLQNDLENQQNLYNQSILEKDQSIEQLTEALELHKKSNIEQIKHVENLQAQYKDLDSKYQQALNDYKLLESKHNELAAQQIQTNLIKQQLDACNIKQSKNVHMLDELNDLKKLKEKLIPAVGQCRFDLKQQQIQSEEKIQVLEKQLVQRQKQVEITQFSQKQLETCQAELKQNKTLVADCKKNILDEKKRLKADTEDKVSKLQQDIQALTLEKNNLLNNNVDANIISTLKTENNLLNSQIKKLQSQYDALIIKQGSQAESLNACLTDKKNWSKQLNQQKDTSAQQMTQLQNQLESQEKQLKQCQDDLQQQQNKLSEFDKHEKELKNQIANISTKNHQQTMTIARLKLQQSKLQSNINEIKSEQHQTTQQLQSTKQDKDQLSEKLQAIKQQELEKQAKEQQEFDKLKALLKDEIKANFVSIKRDKKDSSIRIKITNNLIFKLGDSHISRTGTRILKQVANVLKKFPKRNIKIIGHTDNIPVKKGSSNFIVSNWELSAARAAAAIRYLQHGTNIAPQRMHLVGASQYRPIADSNSKKGRAANRRIEICLLPPDS